MTTSVLQTRNIRTFTVAVGDLSGRCPIQATTKTSKTATAQGDLADANPQVPEDFSHGRINPGTSIPFFVVHLLPLLAIFTGVTWTAVWLLIADLLGPDVLHHRRLSPLLRPPRIQDQPGVPVRAGIRRVHGHAEGPTLVGGPSPDPPPLLRHSHRSAHPEEGFLVEPRRVDPRRRHRRSARGHDEGVLEVPGDPLVSTSTTGSVPGPSACSASSSAVGPVSSSASSCRRCCCGTRPS